MPRKKENFDLFPLESGDGKMRLVTGHMGNGIAWRLGEICQKAAEDPKCGDYIDRGLILRRMLEELGFAVFYTGEVRWLDNNFTGTHDTVSLPSGMKNWTRPERAEDSEHLGRQTDGNP